MSESPDLSSLWTVPPGPGFRTDPMQFRSVADLNELVKRYCHRVCERFDLLVGIPRSGLLCANLFALHLNLPLLPIDTLTEERIRRARGSRGAETPFEGTKRRILVIDDSTNTGGAIERARRTMEPFGHLASEVQYLCAYSAGPQPAHVDHVLEVLPQPRVFEWNLLHHAFTSEFLFDLDGVLCLDGPAELKEDMQPFLNHVANAWPRLIPSVPIGAVVTSRLEKHRAATEGWLRKYGVRYRHLIMLDLPDAETRRKLALHGRFKADVYSRMNGMCFVESELWQAEQIAALTGKAVFSVEGSRFWPARTA